MRYINVGPRFKRRTRMPDTNDEHLVREATRIFLQLHENPDDPELLVARQDFLAQGEKAAAAFAEAERTWLLVGKARKRSTGPFLALAIAAVLLGTLMLAREPLSVLWLADHATSGQQVELMLTSGDAVVLDADTALVDDTNTSVRNVKLLRGAAFFEVESSETPFSVAIGDAIVKVVGTAFETTIIDDAIQVSVEKGIVIVELPGQDVRLLAGEQLRWSTETGIEKSSSITAGAASWRTNRLIADRTRFGDVAAAIDRRLPGTVFVVGDRLANARVWGGFDLNEPLRALRALAATQDARVVSIPHVSTFIMPK